MRRIWLLLAVAIVGCSTMEREPNVFYLTTKSGVREIRISPEWLGRLRAQWTPSSDAVSRVSKLRDADRQWAMDFIALNVETFKKCKLSDLRTVAVRDLGAPITGTDASFHPSRYNEAWLVDYCSQASEWLIYDKAGQLVVAPNETLQ